MEKDIATRRAHQLNPEYPEDADVTMTGYEEALLALQRNRIAHQMRMDEEKHKKKMDVLESEKRYWEQKRCHLSSIKDTSEDKNA